MIEPYPKEMKALMQMINSLRWEKDQCIFVKGKTRDISKNFAAGNANKYSFIHIDGDHSYGSLALDLELAKKLAHEDGIICIDDFFNPCYPQVTACCFNFLAENTDYSIILASRRKCYICYKKSRNTYLKLLIKIIESTSERGVNCILSQTNINEAHWAPIFTVTEFAYNKE